MLFILVHPLMLAVLANNHKGGGGEKIRFLVNYHNHNYLFSKFFHHVLYSIRRGSSLAWKTEYKCIFNYLELGVLVNMRKVGLNIKGPFLVRVVHFDNLKKENQTIVRLNGLKT